MRIPSDGLRSIEQWGGVHWTSMSRAFYGSTSLAINANDVPDLSQVESMDSMFYGINILGTLNLLNSWDVSHVKRMK